MKTYYYTVHKTITVLDDPTFGDIEFYFSRKAWEDLLGDCNLYGLDRSDSDTLLTYCTDFSLR